MTMTLPWFEAHPSRKTAALFLSVAVVSVVALAWMGVRLVRQDRALELRQLEERREAAADRLVAALEQVLAAEERRLDGPPNTLNVPAEDHLALMWAGTSDFRVWPDNALLFHPVMPPGREAPARLYASAEKSEFLDHDYGRAILDLRRFSKAVDPAERAGAQFRLARNYRKAGDSETALKTYEELAESSDQGVSISGVPADLVARRARCVLLEELGRREDLEREAQRLIGDLQGRRWRLDKGSYRYYFEQAARWLRLEPEPDAEQRALAEAVDWLWQNRQAIADVERGSSGRRLFRSSGTSVAILWRVTNERLAAVVAGPGYQRRRWFEPLAGGSEFSPVRIGLRDSEYGTVFGSELQTESPVTSRLASVTGLPWDVAIVNADIEGGASQFSQRRRLMVTVLGLLVILVAAATYFIGRAVSRELAAAHLQSDFVSAVSHEFRTPLTSMRQFTEMLVEDENLPAEKRRAFYGAQERATRRLSRLVESLLDFGRMEAGARPYRFERLDAGRLVKTVAEEFTSETRSSGLAIDWEVPDRGPMVNADREALAQALWNLLDNAIKYSPDRPVVHLEVEAGKDVAIRVRDRGTGIPSSERDRIFRKFVRGSGARASEVKGTGIGLAMVRHIVDAHGGKVLVESKVGEGSTFTILLPKGD